MASILRVISAYVCSFALEQVQDTQGKIFKYRDISDSSKAMPLMNRFEPHRDKTNKMACAPSEDSDQPEHPPSLIRVFPVCLIDS